VLTKLTPGQASAIKLLAGTAEWAKFKEALTTELELLKNMLVETETPHKINRLQGAATALQDVIDIEKIARR
jgi:hypothetical protein